MQWCKDIDEYQETMQQQAEEYNKRLAVTGGGPAASSNYLYKRMYEPGAPLNLDLVEYLINMRKNEYKKNKRLGMRHESNTIQLYTNDITVLETIATKTTKAKFSKIIVSPAGTKYFKRTPPAQYRVYMTNNKVDMSFTTDFQEYLDRTPDLKPCDSFKHSLDRNIRFRHQSVYLWSTHYIDYNDEHNLMMLHLMFPQAIGKAYKLEKK